VILGDPGPYAFSGMTGGVVYQMLSPLMNFDREALQKRVALGAHVAIQDLAANDIQSVQQLLQYYIEALEQTFQYETAEQIKALSIAEIVEEEFVKVVPLAPQASH
jgi:glutamate synthase (NADPH/NADH) large chain